jgi:peptidoglycan/xylan/chitin deacetylase (PgdA/CDA1 family)
MNATGLLDVQAHGYEHRYLVADNPEEVIRRELSEPISILKQHFGHKPIAFVWPGGNFTPRAADLAREAGYRLAFSALSRAPLMYNWIPLGEQEKEVADPLMVLPRFWARPGLAEHLVRAARMSQEAAARALVSCAQEAAYYHEMCGGRLPGSP